MSAVGIIDIGSNTVRLSVIEVRPDGAHLVRHEQKAVLRLASRVSPSGRFAPEAAQDTIGVLGDFLAAGEDWHVARWVAVATAAVRQAADGQSFIREISEATGLAVHILSAEEEARAGLIGALNTLSERDGVAVDIGGGSMEITHFADRRRKAGVSIALGAVTAAARFELRERAKPGSLKSLARMLDAEVQAQDPELLRGQGLPLIGMGGTVRALAKLDRRRRGYPLPAVHNYVMEPTSVLRFRDELVAMPSQARRRVPGMSVDRADLMAAGSALLGWVVERIGPDRVVVSGSGLREGLLFEELLRDRPEPIFDDVLGASVANLERVHALPSGRCERLGSLAGTLWGALGSLGEEGKGVDPRLVPAAARLRDVGTTINYYDRERHAAYMLREGRLFGLDHRQRLLLAAASGYEGATKLRAWLAPYASLLAPGDESLAIRMGIAVLLTHHLDLEARGKAGPLSITVLPSAVRIMTTSGPAQGFAATLGMSMEFRKAFGRALSVTTGTVAS